MTMCIRKCRVTILVACVMVCMSSTNLSAKSEGHDWYCPDDKEHEQYEKHRKMYHDHDVKTLAEMIHKIYADSSLSSEQQRTNTEELLKKEITKTRLGTGD